MHINDTNMLKIPSSSSTYKPAAGIKGVWGTAPLNDLQYLSKKKDQKICMGGLGVHNPQGFSAYPGIQTTLLGKTKPLEQRPLTSPAG